MTKMITRTVNAPAVRLIATESLVNVAGPRLMAMIIRQRIKPHTLNTLNSKLKTMTKTMTMTITKTRTKTKTMTQKLNPQTLAITGGACGLCVILSRCSWQRFNQPSPSCRSGCRCLSGHSGCGGRRGRRWRREQRSRYPEGCRRWKSRWWT